MKNKNLIIFFMVMTIAWCVSSCSKKAIVHETGLVLDELIREFKVEKNKSCGDTTETMIINLGKDEKIVCYGRVILVFKADSNRSDIEIKLYTVASNDGDYEKELYYMEPMGVEIKYEIYYFFKKSGKDYYGDVIQNCQSESFKKRRILLVSIHRHGPVCRMRFGRCSVDFELFYIGRRM